MLLWKLLHREDANIWSHPMSGKMHSSAVRRILNGVVLLKVKT